MWNDFLSLRFTDGVSIWRTGLAERYVVRINQTNLSPIILPVGGPKSTSLPNKVMNFLIQFSCLGINLLSVTVYIMVMFRHLQLLVQ